MCPIDPSPHGGEILHELAQRRFPQPAPGQESDDQSRGLAIADDGKDEPDIAHRPSLPLHPEQMAADIEDEEADPVIDSGPGIADDTRGPKRQ